MLCHAFEFPREFVMKLIRSLPGFGGVEHKESEEMAMAPTERTIDGTKGRKESYSCAQPLLKNN